MTHKCDCLNDCGDDPDLKHGIAEPCKALALWRASKPPRIVNIDRSEKHDFVVIVSFVRAPTDLQIETVKRAIMQEAERYIP